VLKIASEQAGAPRGTDMINNIVTVAHVVPGILLIIAWSLLCVGIARAPALQPAKKSD
jgi:hypothetical protein